MDESEEFITVIPSNQIVSPINTCGEEEVRQDEVQLHKVTKLKHEIPQKPENLSDSAESRRDRRGSSYVWSYCIRMSRNEIRCKLCQKVMSFHGTANVITHLQRIHNIIGGSAHDSTASFDDESIGSVNLRDEPFSTAFWHRNRRSPANRSVVWQYYTRVSQDWVRCNLCQKRLSFQGTSNCQRHLHRIHGIAAAGRMFSGLKRETIDKDSLIREYCESTEDNKMKCNMCSITFDETQCDEIRKHLTVTHAITTKAPAKRRRRPNRDVKETSDDTDECDYNNEDESCQVEKTHYNMVSGAANIKSDVPTFEDIIEEDNAEENYCDEDPFDPTRLQDYPEARLISVNSSRDGSPEPTIKISVNSNKLRSLNEERMRMETQYFREKAGYYRMQKYHIALQAKKAKIELQRLESSGLNGTIYNANIDL
ncbi:uncharacterized protein [Eurosta solidaginis]|uniref:uncharacterized protein n=1 Tax=Eurosta solidaginis TaxID=178769 RepID=UPI0035310237